MQLGTLVNYLSRIRGDKAGLNWSECDVISGGGNGSTRNTNEPLTSRQTPLFPLENGSFVNLAVLLGEENG